MQQLGINLGPTQANIVAWGQLVVNMYLAKPEKLVFRLDGSTIFRVFAENACLHVSYILNAKTATKNPSETTSEPFENRCQQWHVF